MGTPPDEEINQASKVVYNLVLVSRSQRLLEVVRPQTGGAGSRMLVEGTQRLNELVGTHRWDQPHIDST